MLIIPSIVLIASLFVDEALEEHAYRQYQMYVKESCKATENDKNVLLCADGSFVQYKGEGK